MMRRGNCPARSFRQIVWPLSPVFSSTSGLRRIRITIPQSPYEDHQEPRLAQLISIGDLQFLHAFCPAGGAMAVGPLRTPALGGEPDRSGPTSTRGLRCRVHGPHPCPCSQCQYSARALGAGAASVIAWQLDWLHGLGDLFSFVETKTPGRCRPGAGTRSVYSAALSHCQLYRKRKR